MKTLFKLTFLAAAISLSITACQSNKPASAGDTTKVDSSSSVKSTIDTAIKVDTGKNKLDSTKKDTLSKTITKNVEVKKTIIKKKSSN